MATGILTSKMVMIMMMMMMKMTMMLVMMMMTMTTTIMLVIMVVMMMWMMMMVMMAILSFSDSQFRICRCMYAYLHIHVKVTDDISREEKISDQTVGRFNKIFLLEATACTCLHSYVCMHMPNEKKRGFLEKREVYCEERWQALCLQYARVDKRRLQPEEELPSLREVLHSSVCL